MTGRLLVVGSLLALAGACAVESDTSRAASAVIGGEPDAGDPAVVLLAAWPADLSELDLCTATIVGPDVLLTAAHCVDPQTHADGAFGVFFGADANAYPSASTLIPKLAGIADIHIHPDYDRDAPFTADIAIVILAEPVSTKPLPIARAPLDPSLIGAPARIVGYGQTTYEVPNAQKHQADTVLAAIDEGDTITVGDVDHKTCIGDSGGPALMMIDGVETVVGVNSYTDLAGCLEPAHYRRTDAYVAFLDTFVPPPVIENEGGGGGTASSSASTGSGDGAGGEDAINPEREGEEDDGGCSVGGGSGAPSWLVIAALGLVVSRRRKPRG